MCIGEVSLLTNDVKRLADFYKQLLGVDNKSEDDVHQTILSEEPMLTVYNDGTAKNNQNQNIILQAQILGNQQICRHQPAPEQHGKVYKKRHFVPNFKLPDRKRIGHHACYQKACRCARQRNEYRYPITAYKL